MAKNKLIILGLLMLLFNVFSVYSASWYDYSCWFNDKPELGATITIYDSNGVYKTSDDYKSTGHIDNLVINEGDQIKIDFGLTTDDENNIQQERIFWNHNTRNDWTIGIQDNVATTTTISTKSPSSTKFDFYSYLTGGIESKPQYYQENSDLIDFNDGNPQFDYVRTFKPQVGSYELLLIVSDSCGDGGIDEDYTFIPVTVNPTPEEIGGSPDYYVCDGVLDIASYSSTKDQIFMNNGCSDINFGDDMWSSPSTWNIYDNSTSNLDVSIDKTGMSLMSQYFKIYSNGNDEFTINGFGHRNKYWYIYGENNKFNIGTLDGFNHQIIKELRGELYDDGGGDSIYIDGNFDGTIRNFDNVYFQGNLLEDSLSVTSSVNFYLDVDTQNKEFYLNTRTFLDTDYSYIGNTFEDHLINEINIENYQDDYAFTGFDTGGISSHYYYEDILFDGTNFWLYKDYQGNDCLNRMDSSFTYTLGSGSACGRDIVNQIGGIYTNGYNIASFGTNKYIMANNIVYQYNNDYSSQTGTYDLTGYTQTSLEFDTKYAYLLDGTNNVIKKFDTSFNYISDININSYIPSGVTTRKINFDVVTGDWFVYANDGYLYKFDNTFTLYPQYENKYYIGTSYHNFAIKNNKLYGLVRSYNSNIREYDTTFSKSVSNSNIALNIFELSSTPSIKINDGFSNELNLYKEYSGINVGNAWINYNTGNDIFSCPTTLNTVNINNRNYKVCNSPVEIYSSGDKSIYDYIIVTDESQGGIDITLPIDEENKQPNAIIKLDTSQEVEVGTTVCWDTTNSFDPDGTIVKKTVWEGDKVYTNKDSNCITKTSSDIISVKLQVEDNSGDKAEDIVYIKWSGDSATCSANIPADLVITNSHYQDEFYWLNMTVSDQNGDTDFNYSWTVNGETIYGEDIYGEDILTTVNYNQNVYASVFDGCNITSDYMYIDVGKNYSDPIESIDVNLVCSQSSLFAPANVNCEVVKDLKGENLDSIYWTYDNDIITENEGASIYSKNIGDINTHLITVTVTTLEGQVESDYYRFNFVSQPPTSGGGGGGTTPIEKISCDIDVPNSITIDENNLIVPITLENNEDGSWSPDYVFLNVEGEDSVLDDLSITNIIGTLQADESKDVGVKYDMDIFNTQPIDAQNIIRFTSDNCKDVDVKINVRINTEQQLLAFVDNELLSSLSPDNLIESTVLTKEQIGNNDLLEKFKIWHLAIILFLISMFIFWNVKYSKKAIPHYVTKSLILTLVTGFSTIVMIYLIRWIIGLF